MSTLLNDEDYKQPFPSFLEKIANLDSSKQKDCTSEYYRRLQAENEKLTLANKKLAAEKEKLAAEKEKMAAENEKMTAENEKMAAANEKMTAANEKMAADYERASKIIKVMETISALATGSSTDVFSSISGLEIAPEEYRTCPRDNILESWSKCRTSYVMPDLAEDETSEIDESKVQTAFLAGLGLILSTLRYKHALLDRTSVHGSKQIPDIIIANQGIIDPGVMDVLAIIELKAPHVALHHAASQAAAYFSKAAEGRIKYKSNDESEIRCSIQLLKSLIAIGSNYKEICIFGYSKSDSDPKLQVYRRPQSSCFPKGWRKMENPTDGFIDLCHAIYQTGDATAKYITINNSDVIITGTIYEGEGIGVYRCTYLNQDIAIKQGFGKRGKGFVELELEKFKTVSHIYEFRSYLLPWKHELNIKYGFAMPYGTVISESDLHEEGVLERHYRWLIEGLRILHSKQFYHMDIRPGNIVIYDKTARFIDWLTLQKGGEVVYAWLRQGQDDPFWPVHREKFNEHSLFDLWDLISLGYTFLFLAADNNVRLELCKSRLDEVEKLTTDPTLVGKMARIIQYLETTSVDDVDSNRNVFYETCLMKLTTIPNAI